MHLAEVSVSYLKNGLGIHHMRIIFLASQQYLCKKLDRAELRYRELLDPINRKYEPDLRRKVEAFGNFAAGFKTSPKTCRSGKDMSKSTQRPVSDIRY